MINDIMQHNTKQEDEKAPPTLPVYNCSQCQANPTEAMQSTDALDLGQ
jgi:hypothetical protein